MLTETVHTFVVQGDHVITLTETTAAGCVASVNQVVYAGATPIAAFSATGPICAGGFVTFTNETAGSITAAWSFGDGGTSTVLSPTHQYMNPGIYTVVMTATDAGGCGDSVTQTLVTVNDLPQPDLFYSPSVVTATETTVTFSDVGTGGVTWEWSFGDGVTTTSGVSQTTHMYLTAGVKTVVLTTTNATGCLSTDQLTIEVKYPPQKVCLPILFDNHAGAGPDLVVLNGVINVNPVNPRPCPSSSTVSVWIKNMGTTDSGPFYVSYYVDQAWGINKAYTARTLVTNLGPRESKQLSWTGCFNAPGPHLLWVMADASGDASFGSVLESREENNVSEPLVVFLNLGFALGEKDTAKFDGEGWGRTDGTIPQEATVR